MSGEALSLGNTTLRAHGMEGRIPVVSTHFVTADHRLPLPSPEGDFYLVNLAVPASREGEKIVCLRLIDGLKDYYRHLGLLSPKTDLIELTPTRNGEKKLGHPHTDPLELLGASPKYFDPNEVLVTEFYTPAITEQAKRAGIRILSMPDSVTTNNKALLRQASGDYKIPMLPGVVFDNFKEGITYLDSTGGSENGTWLKFPTGSGGDLVRKMKPRNGSDLTNEVLEMRESVQSGFNQADLGINFLDFWPKEAVSPAGLPMVLESDARNLGEVVINGSNHFVTFHDGRVEVLGYFQQIISPIGEYIGSKPFTPQGRVADALQRATENVARYNMEENGYFGIQGIDYFSIRNPLDGQEDIYVMELNSRPIISTFPAIISDKLGSPSWINTNVYTQRPVTMIDDFIDIIGKDLALGNSGLDGLVVPQAFRTLNFGQAEGMIPSPNFKIAIFGRDSDHCKDITQILGERGVRFTP